MSIFSTQLSSNNLFQFVEKRVIFTETCGSKVRSLGNNKESQWDALSKIDVKKEKITQECKTNIKNVKDNITDLKDLKITSLQTGLDAYKALGKNANTFTKTLILQAIFHQTNAGKKKAKKFGFLKPDGYGGPITKKMWNYINLKNDSISADLQFTGDNHDAIYDALVRASEDSSVTKTPSKSSTAKPSNAGSEKLPAVEIVEKTGKVEKTEQEISISAIHNAFSKIGVNLAFKKKNGVFSALTDSGSDYKIQINKQGKFCVSKQDKSSDWTNDIAKLFVDIREIPLSSIEISSYEDLKNGETLTVTGNDIFGKVKTFSVINETGDDIYNFSVTKGKLLFSIDDSSLFGFDSKGLLAFYQSTDYTSFGYTLPDELVPIQKGNNLFIKKKTK